jgi:hypothetical protein
MAIFFLHISIGLYQVISDAGIIVLMIKVRVFLFFITIVVVGVIGLFVSYYARGYKLNLKTFRFQPNGILVVKSEPDGASVFINGSLKTATNATISLPPGTYDVEVKKDGFFPWYKRLTIEKEIVTQAGASLFKNVPSLFPVTLSGASNTVVSSDGGKIAFSVLPSQNNDIAKTGLWVMDTVNLPLGFNNGPKMVTDGDLTNASYIFSPDGRQILLTASNGIFLLDSGSFTAQGQRVNIASKKDLTLAGWQKELDIKNTALTRNLPPELQDILFRKASSFTFSPDEQVILYTATASANIAENIIKPLPGASTQRQERNIEEGHKYIYDIKEDRNFLVSDGDAVLRWMPSSRHLLLADTDRVVVMDYDGTNRQVVYSGSYLSPSAFPYINSTKILILTNFGAASATPNLYTLTVK